jgi:hypothetical protein
MLTTSFPGERDMVKSTEVEVGVVEADVNNEQLKHVVFIVTTVLKISLTGYLI